MPVLWPDVLGRQIQRTSFRDINGVTHLQVAASLHRQTSAGACTCHPVKEWSAMETLRNALLVAAAAIVGCQDPRLLAATAASPVGSTEAVADTGAAFHEITIPAGTALSLQMASTVSSASSRIEQPVTATLRRPIVVEGRTIVPAGAAVTGYVSQVQRSGRVKGRALVGVRFTRLRVGDTRYTIETGNVARRAPATKKADATKIGIGAGAGALVGALTGGKKGAAIGSGLGAAGGTAVVLSTRGREVSIGRGALLTARLAAPVTVHVPWNR